MSKAAVSKVIIRSSLTVLVGLTLAITAFAADENSRPERPKKPPVEAFTACETLAVGDACIVVTPRGEVNGMCRAAPKDQEGPLACIPERRRGGKGGDRPPRGQQ